MGRVLHNTESSASVPKGVDVLSGGEAAVSYFLGIFDHPLQRLFSSRTVSVPGSNGKGECTLHHTPVKCVNGPCDVVGNVYPEILETGDHFHSCTSNEEERGNVTSPP